MKLSILLPFMLTLGTLKITNALPMNNSKEEATTGDGSHNINNVFSIEEQHQDGASIKDFPPVQKSLGIDLLTEALNKRALRMSKNDKVRNGDTEGQDGASIQDTRDIKNGLDAYQQHQGNPDDTYQLSSVQNDLDATEVLVKALEQRIVQGCEDGFLHFAGMDCSAILTLTKLQRASIVESTITRGIRHLLFGELQGIDDQTKAKSLRELFVHLRPLGNTV